MKETGNGSKEMDEDQEVAQKTREDLDQKRPLEVITWGSLVTTGWHFKAVVEEI